MFATTIPRTALSGQRQTCSRAVVRMASYSFSSSSKNAFSSMAAALPCLDNEVEPNVTPHTMLASSFPKMVLILGKPGGGKGTISGKILQDFPSFSHVSTGDLLRQHVRSQTELGKEAKAFMDAGALVPDQLMIDLVLDAAAEMTDTDTTTSCNTTTKSLLLDGFPRNVVQAHALENNHPSSSGISVDWVVNLNVPTETIVERIADRWIHPASGRVYSYSYQPPKQHGLDDVTGEPLIQRTDDQPETVRQRLQAYDEVTAPLVDYYEQKGVLQTFSGTQSDVLYPQVRQWLMQQGFVAEES